MAVVARRYGIGTGQLYTWRKQLLRGAMAGFVPVELTPAEPLTTPSDPGRIEIRRSGGFTVSIAGLVDKGALRFALGVIGGLERLTRLCTRLRTSNCRFRRDTDTRECLVIQQK